MKAFGITLIAGLMVAGAASAGEDDLRWTFPSFETHKAMWAHDASGHLLYGRVKLDCGVGADKAATDCKVLSAEPNDPAQIKAAMDLSALYKMKDSDVRRAVIDIDLRYDQEATLAKAPTREQIAAAVPTEAKGASGSGVVECVSQADGSLRSCEVLRAVTSTPGFAAAALAIAQLYKLKPAMREGQPTESTVAIPIRYGSSNFTNPDWLRKPTFDQMMAVYPGEAAKRGVGGVAVIKCVVQTNGLTRDCTVVKEDHPGLGFGPAAIVLSRTLLFKPALRDGQPVEAEVSIPINFAMSGSGGGGWTGDGRSAHSRDLSAPPIPVGSNPTRILGTAVWSKTPSVPEIQAEIDKKVGDKFADGLVVLQCLMDGKTGKLSSCIVANASPGMAQFQGVARALAPKFQADPATFAGIKGDALINLAFAFPDMSSPAWSKRYLTHPRWIRTISPDPNKATFPETAAKAGLKTGMATVDCVVAPDGALSQCQVVSESTPNVGFGNVAIRIAEAFMANPWDDDGLPVGGAHVRMPIRMDYDPPADPPAPPAPTPATKP